MIPATSASSAPRASRRSLASGVGVLATMLFVALATQVCDRLWLVRHPLLAVQVAAVVLVAAGLTAWFGVRRPARASDALFLGCTLALFIASRLPWVLWSPTLPVSDFAFYDALARDMAGGGPVAIEWPMMGVIAAWGYPIALALPYALIADDLLVARSFNLLLGATTLIALHALARRAGGVAVARVACVLFLLWPAQWFFASMPASEHLALPMLLAALACAAYATDERRGRSGLAVLGGAGVLLGACLLTRSASGTAALAVLIALSLDGTRPFTERLARCAVVVVAFAVTVAGSLALMDVVFAARPAGGGWWSVFVGANIAEGGRWNHADAQSFVAHPDIATANRFARDGALARVVANPRGYLGLVVAKISSLWSDGAHGFWWSAIAMTEGLAADRLNEARAVLQEIAQAFHALALALAALGIGAVVSRSRMPGGVLVPLLALLLATLAHGVVETQSRYNFPLVPLLFVFDGIAVAWLAGARAARAQPQPSLRATTSQHSTA